MREPDLPEKDHAVEVSLLVMSLIVRTRAATTLAQSKDTILDEAHVPAYVLPDPLIAEDVTAFDWEQYRNSADRHF